MTKARVLRQAMRRAARVPPVHKEQLAPVPIRRLKVMPPPIRPARAPILPIRELLALTLEPAVGVPKEAICRKLRLRFRCWDCWEWVPGQPACSPAGKIDKSGKGSKNWVACRENSPDNHPLLMSFYGLVRRRKTSKQGALSISQTRESRRLAGNL